MTHSTIATYFPLWGTSEIAAASGDFGDVSELDGSSQYFSIADDTVFDIGTGDISIEAWFRPDAVGAAQEIVSQATSNNQYTLLRLNANGTALFELSLDAAVQHSSVTSQSSFNNANIWHHIVAVIDRDSAANSRIYRSGIDVTSGTPTVDNGANTQNVGGELHIGHSPVLSPNYFNGPMVIVRWYKGTVLTAANALALFNNGKGLRYADFPGSVPVPDAAWDLTAENTTQDLVGSLDLTNNGSIPFTARGPIPPTTVNGLQICVDAKIGVTHASSKVSNWEDLSRKSHDLVQATEGDKPGYDADGLNSNPTLTFDGTDEHMTAPDHADFNASGNGATMIFVGELDGTSAFSAFYSHGDGTTRSRAGAEAASNRYASIEWIQDGSNQRIANSNGTSLNDTPAVWSITTDYSTVELYENGTEDAGVAFNTSTGTITGYNPATDLFLGRTSWVDSGHWKGKCSGFALYDRKLLASDRQNIENWWKDRYGIS